MKIGTVSNLWYRVAKRMEGMIFAKMVMVVQSLTHVQLLATPRIVALQTPLLMEFPRREYWSGLPFPSPEDLPDPAIEPVSSALSPASQSDSLPLSRQSTAKLAHPYSRLFCEIFPFGKLVIQVSYRRLYSLLVVACPG